MKILGVDHIGIMCADVNAASLHYGKKIGLETESFLFSEKFGCKIAMVPCGSLKLELMEPAKTGAGRDWLNSHGEGIHHICYIVTDLEAAYREAVALGADREDGLIMSAEGKQVFFMKAGELNGVISEFVQA